MNRMQITLRRAEYQVLRRLAKEKKVSMAELVRRAVTEVYSSPQSKNKKNSNSAWSGLAGMAEGAGEAVARNHDHYLYPSRKKK